MTSKTSTNRFEANNDQQCWVNLQPKCFLLSAFSACEWRMEMESSR